MVEGMGETAGEMGEKGKFSIGGTKIIMGVTSFLSVSTELGSTSKIILCLVSSMAIPLFPTHIAVSLSFVLVCV